MGLIVVRINVRNEKKRNNNDMETIETKISSIATKVTGNNDARVQVSIPAAHSKNNWLNEKKTIWKPSYVYG